MSERRIRNNRLKRYKECRRNRILCALAACFTLLFAFSADSFSANASAHTKQEACKYYTSVRIQEDDTLYSIADTYMDMQHYASEEEYIRELCRINFLEDETILTGMYLVVPYYDTTPPSK